jgi:hypothetical protein
MSHRISTWSDSQASPFAGVVYPVRSARTVGEGGSAIIFKSQGIGSDVIDAFKALVKGVDAGAVDVSSSATKTLSEIVDAAKVADSAVSVSDLARAKNTLADILADSSKTSDLYELASAADSLPKTSKNVIYDLTDEISNLGVEDINTNLAKLNLPELTSLNKGTIASGLEGLDLAAVDLSKAATIDVGKVSSALGEDLVTVAGADTGSVLKSAIGTVTSLAKPIEYIGIGTGVALAGGALFTALTTKSSSTSTSKITSTDTDPCSATNSPSLSTTEAAACTSCNATIGATMTDITANNSKATNLTACVTKATASTTVDGSGTKKTTTTSTTNTPGACASSYTSATDIANCQSCGGDTLDTADSAAVTTYKSCVSGKGSSTKTTPTNTSTGTTTTTDPCTASDAGLTTSQVTQCETCRSTYKLTASSDLGLCISCLNSFTDTASQTTCIQCIQQGGGVITTAGLETCLASAGVTGTTSSNKTSATTTAASTGVVATLQKYEIPIVVGALIIGVAVIGTHGTYWGKKKPKMMATLTPKKR